MRQATQRSSATTRSPTTRTPRRRRRFSREDVGGGELPAIRHGAPGNLPDRVEPGGELPRPGSRRAAASQFGRVDVEHLDTGRDPMRARVTQQPAVAAPQR